MFGGEKGIRTLGTHKGYNSFRDCPVRPLRHLSKIAQKYKKSTIHIQVTSNPRRFDWMFFLFRKMILCNRNVSMGLV